MKHTKEFIASLTGLPRFNVKADGSNTGEAMKAVHSVNGKLIAVYAGTIAKPRFFDMEELGNWQCSFINDTLNQIRAEYEKAKTPTQAWAWPTAESMAHQHSSNADATSVKQTVATNCWPFPVTYEVPEPDAEEEKRADAEIDVEHEIDLLQDKNVCAKRVAEVIALFDAWMPQRTLHVHADLNELAAETLQSQHAMSHAQHIVYDTYQDNVKVIVSYTATAIHYQIARSSANGKYWYDLWIFPAGTCERHYADLGPDLLKIDARESDLEFAQKVDAGINRLLDAVYKAAD